MRAEEFIKIVKRIVAEYERKELDEDDTFDENVHIVWQVKALGNYKATAITDSTVGKMYYEITYEGSNGLIYFNIYKKQKNKKIISDFVLNNIKQEEETISDEYGY